MRDCIPRFILFVVADAMRVLLSTWSPPYPKGCSMGAERVIKGCSAQNHPNVIPRYLLNHLSCRIENVIFYNLRILSMLQISYRGQIRGKSRASRGQVLLSISIITYCFFFYFRSISLTALTLPSFLGRHIHALRGGCICVRHGGFFVSLYSH